MPGWPGDTGPISILLNSQRIVTQHGIARTHIGLNFPNEKTLRETVRRSGPGYRLTLAQPRHDHAEHRRTRIP